MQNSWGAEWGDKGFLWLAYDTFKEDAIDGAYVIRVRTPRAN